MAHDSIIIIGGGFAGLSAGIYAQMNGYRTRIFELHTLPGGLCTAWKRKGYTIDGCVHWLVGSAHGNRMWREVGVAQGREFVYADEYMRYEGKDGRTLILYADVDRLENHLLEFSPSDAEPIQDFTRGIRMCLGFDMPSDTDPLFKRMKDGLKLGLKMMAQGRKMRRWMNVRIEDFVARFQDPVLKEAFRSMWIPEFSVFFMLFTFAFLHERNAGYPIGGSLPMSMAMAERYTGLGGEIHYGRKVEKILVEDDKAVGVKLADGSEHRAGRVISAADGHATIFDMLEGRYADDKIREPYESWPIFEPVLYVGLGVDRTFDEEPKSVSGMVIELPEPVEIGHTTRTSLPVHIFNQDPTLAPEGKTSITVMLASRYDYWKDLARDRAAYQAKKDQAARTIVELLDRRFPGLAQQVEMTDVATPLTFERYTGNWQGSFEGWLITPDNSHTMMKPMSQTLPGLGNFSMCGQWVEPGGGLPTGVRSGRRLLKTICKQDRRKFKTTVD